MIVNLQLLKYTLKYAKLIIFVCGLNFTAIKILKI